MSILADHEIAALCRPDSVCKVIVSRVDTGDVIHTFTGFATNGHTEQVLDKLINQAFVMFGVSKSPNSLSVIERSVGGNWKQMGKGLRLDTDITEFEFSEEAKGFKPMIENFEPQQVRSRLRVNPDQPDDREHQRIISYGLSSYGYDFRVAEDFKLFTNINSSVVDPLDFDPKCFIDVKGEYCLVPPNSFVLARTVEKFNMPEDVVAVCTGKSTIARSGLSIMVTPAEPDWSGYLTLEFANTTPLPVKLYANMGGGQFMFYRGSRPDVTYADRSGKYQNQPAEVITPRV